MKHFITIAALVVILTAHGTGTFTLIEINPLHGNSPLTVLNDSAKTFYGAGALSGFTELNSKMYFSAQSSPGDDELWVSDGTVAGTSLVKAINPGHGAGIGNLVLVNNHVLFMATDNGSTWDLWSTDGTDTGTVKIDQLNAQNNAALGPYNASVMGNRLVFCAQQKLLVTDGTRTGTDSLLSIVNYSQGFGYCELNGKTYFILPELSGGNEVWSTDGTISGTQQVLDLSNTSYNIASANEVLSFNGQIYLTATDSGQTSTGLFMFDGTVNGQLNQVTIGTGNPNPFALKLFNGALYFIATDSVSSNLYQIASGNFTPVPLIPNSTYHELSNLSFANNTAYCIEPGANRVHAVDLSGLTHSVLSLPGYYLPDFPYKEAAFMVNIGQQIFFEAYDSTTGDQVFIQSDFTGAGTQVMAPAGSNTRHPFNCYLTNTIEDIFDLQVWNNKIIMPADFNDAGRELWIFDPGITSAVKELSAEETFTIFPNPSSDELKIKTSQCSNCGQRVDIFDAKGQLVLQKILNEETTTIQLASFAPGNYFIALNKNGKVIGTKQLVLVK